MVEEAEGEREGESNEIPGQEEEVGPEERARSKKLARKADILYWLRRYHNFCPMLYSLTEYTVWSARKVEQMQLM